MGNNNKAPCYGCERRDAHCHSSCEDYKKFSKSRGEELSLLRKKRADDAMMTDVKMRSIEKSTREKLKQGCRKA